MLRVLAVDDDKELLSSMEESLSSKYALTTAKDSDKALELLDNNAYDCILLDIVMPDKNGYELCRSIRQKTDCTIIFMSCLTEEETVAKCFELGADDFISKPFKFGELQARIDARSGKKAASELVYGNLLIDRAHNRVTYSKEPIFLTNIEFELLYYLASHPYEPYSKEDLYNQIWNQAPLDSTHTVQAHIFTLRKKLQEVTNKEYITTYWKKGYFFNPRA